jgi:hypothetical protein
MSGKRIGRVKVIFRLPSTIPSQVALGTLEPSNYPQEPLACIEWYSKLQGAADPNHMMYRITKSPPRADGSVPTSIIPLSDIHQSCQLFPFFSNKDVDSTWTTHNSLDQCSVFLVNNWRSLYSYQTIW